MAQQDFAFGDQVRHPGRPEWGVGSVSRIEVVQVDGARAQRVSVRFPGQGLKTFNTGHVTLERTGDADQASSVGLDEAPAAAVFASLTDADWMADVNRRRIGEAMRTLPESARDPFTSPATRLERTVALYRFERHGAGLIDWAVAQTGLDDPLSRFNRHELEAFFDRWALERDAHLGRVLAEPELGAGDSRRILADAPDDARRMAKRLTTRR